MECPFAQPEYGPEEWAALERVWASKWLAGGPENEAFEEEFARVVGARHAVCVNSGSSANLLALASLQLPPWSTVITGACGFPATLAPILHLGYKPLLVDYDLATHNINVAHLLDLLPQAQAVLLAHTLGNPVEMRPIMALARETNCAIIEDCCEALGSTLGGRSVGSFGTLGTFSFYPSHQITALGGGGMVVTDDATLARRMRSMRDWGKLAVAQGPSPTTYQPLSKDLAYYPGYTYETVGYNMKLPDANAAFGRVQLTRLARFVADRQARYAQLHGALATVPWFWQPTSPADAYVSWFGYPLTLTRGSRDALGEHLEAAGVRHRPFFAGNLLRQAPFAYLGRPDDFPVADHLMRSSCFVGVWPGLGPEQMAHMMATIQAWHP